MNNKKGIRHHIYSENTIIGVEEKMLLLGTNNKLNALKLLDIRIVLTIAIFFILLYTLHLGYFIAPIVSFVFYQSFFKIFLDPKIEKRKRILERDSLHFFEILSLSLEAGRSIKTAIEVTCKNIDSELSSEFKKVVKDVNYGKSLDEALDDLKHRIPSDTINNIILNIRQANIFGNNIIDTVYSQISYIREKRVLETKAYISKIPVKISIISVIFFIPLFLLLLLGPMIINLIG